jgi:two-component system, cell cycle sensor histidine kinase DivJ
MFRCVHSNATEHGDNLAISGIILEHLDSLVHPSANSDAITSARHRAFIAPRLLGSLIVLASLPLYLVFRGELRGIEAMVFAWLMAPILVSYYLSRTGRYESAHVLSAIALAFVVFAVCSSTGGISSFATIWLIVIPLEAALSASRRIVGFAILLALSCVCGLVALEAFGSLPQSQVPAHLNLMFQACGITSATIYAAALGFGAELVARTSKKLLNAEEERYRLLAYNISDVISRHGRNGAVRFISAAAEAMLNVPPGQLLEHGLFDRVHVADRPAYLTALSDTARTGEEHSVEFRLQRNVSAKRVNHSEFLWVEMRCRPFAIKNDSIGELDAEVVTVMRDITERKMHEQALRIARMEAERASEAKARFLATMSHELRTPLNAIIGFSEMIAREGDIKVDASRRKEYASLINESGLHLLSVVNGILDMSKMESGNFEIVPEPFAPGESLISCCNLMALKAHDKGIDLVTRVSSDVPLMTGDPRAFRQILLNLLSNAIKFSERGGAVTVAMAIEGAHLLVRVIDAGVGIGAEDIKRLGVPFFQAGNAYQRRHEGTGLGLSIVKGLVALHEGKLIIDSKIGEGTTVTVILPIVHTPSSNENVTNIAPSAHTVHAETHDYQVKISA